MHSTKRRNDIRERIEEIILMYKSKTSYEIALALEVSRCLITTILKENNIKLRTSHKRRGIRSWNKGKKYLQIMGDKNPNWKGGITPLMIRIRRCFEYKNWVRNILRRDNWTCVFCNQRGGNMEVDHYPEMFAQIIEKCFIDTF